MHFRTKQKLKDKKSKNSHAKYDAEPKDVDVQEVVLSAGKNAAISYV